MKPLIAVALACVLSSCMTTEQREAQNDKYCSDVAPPQTHDYAVCRMMRDEQYEAHRMATKRALMAIGSGIYAAGAAPPAAEPAPSTDLICDRSGPGQMRCH